MAGGSAAARPCASSTASSASNGPTSPRPRAVAFLAGLKVKDLSGDAVILGAIEPSVQLDQYLNDHELRGEPVPDHLGLAKQLTEIVYALGRAQLGHEDLHLGNFLLHGEGVPPRRLRRAARRGA